MVKIAEGKDYTNYGVLGIVAIVAVVGLVLLFSERLELGKEAISSDNSGDVTGAFTILSKQDCVSSSTRPCYDKQTGKKIIGLEAKGGEKAFAVCLKSKVIGSSGSYTAETPICDGEKFQYCYEGKSKVFLRKFEGVCGKPATEPESQPLLSCPRIEEFYPLSFLDTSWSMSSPTQNYILTTMFKSKSGALYATGFKMDYSDENHWGGLIPVMYKSTDNGVSWTSVTLPYTITNEGTTYSSSWDVVFSMAEDQNGVLYAAGYTLWKSTDGGNTWSALTLPYPGTHWGGKIPMKDIIVAKDNSLIAVFEDVFSTASPNDPYYFRPKVSRSTDRGNTWNELFSNDYFITSIVEANDGSLVFRDLIAGGAGGVYRYSNGAIINTFIEGPVHEEYNAGVLKARDGSIYFISVEESVFWSGIDPGQPGAAYLSAYKSTDNGITWTRLGALPASGGIEGPIVEASDNTLYATSGSNCYGGTIYKSADRGATWSIIATAPIFGRGKHSDPYFGYEISSFVDVSGKVLIAGNAPVIFSTP